MFVYQDNLDATHAWNMMGFIHNSSGNIFFVDGHVAAFPNSRPTGALVNP